MSRPFFTTSHFCWKYGGFEAGLKRFFLLLNEHPNDLKYIADYYHFSVAQASKYRKILARPVFIPSVGAREYMEFEISQKNHESEQIKKFLQSSDAQIETLRLVVGDSHAE